MALAGIDMAIGLGRGHQGLEDRLAVQLGLGRRQAVEGLRLALRRLSLLRLPIAIGLVGNHPKCGQAAVGQRLAAKFASFLVA
ncbi:hypothetical protein D9M68_787370 [compost metagenome]